MESGAARLELGAILTGGAASRMGGRKADLTIGGLSLAEMTHGCIAPLCRNVVCVGGKGFLADRGVPTIPDLFPGADSMGGVATALKYALDNMGPDSWVLCVGCDMPFISPALLTLLSSKREGCDIVTPHSGPGFEPLCSLYRAGIFPVFDRRIKAGWLSIRDVFPQVATKTVREEELRSVDPRLCSFVNVNRPGDLEAVRKILEGGGGKGA